MTGHEQAMAEIQHHPIPRLSVEPFLARYKNERRRRNIAPLYEAMLAEVKHLASPTTVHGEYPLDEVSELGAWFLPGSVAVVFGICTVGQKLERRIKELFQDEPHEAVVLDEIGVEIVRGLARDLRAIVKGRAAARGLKAGPGYRPGIGRWPLEAQRVLFARLPAGEIGVELNENLIMTPTRSISLIIPLIQLETQ